MPSCGVGADGGGGRRTDHAVTGTITVTVNSPVATMRDYLDQMAAPTQLPAPDVAYPKIIGANGPKMLALSGEIADGALPAMAPPEFTAQARQLLGPGKLLA
jgi:alkanesulfonate monooxygenase SsuD/methylene tetrahydromethanopterin reductase-like flavin-dependent oxidoreductase (luciferase family)